MTDEVKKQDHFYTEIEIFIKKVRREDIRQTFFDYC